VDESLAGDTALQHEGLTDGVKDWLSSQAATFFDVGIQKLISCYNKCLNSEGDYVEKQPT
jgi:hypothetical protein